MKLKLIEKNKEISDCISFIFQPEQPITWKPGQFLHYTLPHQNPDDRGEKRFFTIASAPFEKNVRITTRFTPEKGSSFKNSLKDWEVGMEIKADGPNGSFTLEDPSKNYVFMAGGIGITPFRSILLDLDHNNKPINIILLYANRSSEIVYRDELESLMEKHPQFKIEYAIDPRKIDVQFIKDRVGDLSDKMFYLSGPKPFVDGMKANLLELQIAEEQIKTDYFPGYDSH